MKTLKEYLEPEMKEVRFSQYSDVIVTSGFEDGTSGDGIGDGEDIGL